MGACTVDQHELDVQLVQRSLAGDATARDELVARLGPVVSGVCFRMLGHGPDAEDTIQEVFLRVFKHLASWDQRRPLHSWVASIAVNRCRTTLARNHRRGPVLAADAELVAPSPVDPAPELNEALLEALRNALAELRPEYRTVVRLFHLEGKGYDEIAAILDRPIGTVKTWLHRARGELARKLAQQGWNAEKVRGTTVSLDRLLR